MDIPEGLIVMTREGIRVRLHRDGMWDHIFLFGVYEPANTYLYRKLIRLGDVALDVGGNWGWYTALFAKWVGPEGSVHAFEPVRQFADQILDTVQLNACQACVTVVNSGLGAATGMFTVYSFPGLPQGHSSASDLGRVDAVPHKCQLTTLDDYCATRKLGRIDFVKVDVEGYEPDVFKGGAAALTREDAPMLAFEINPDCLSARGMTAQEVFRILRGYGYDLFWSVLPSGRLEWAPLHSKDLAGDFLTAKNPRIARILQLFPGLRREVEERMSRSRQNGAGSGAEGPGVSHTGSSEGSFPP